MLFKNQEALGVKELISDFPSWTKTLIYVAGALLFGIIFYFLAPKIINLFSGWVKRVERKLSELSMQQIFVGVIGLLAGLIIAFFISLLIQKIRINAIVIALDVLVFAMFAYLGFKIPSSRIKEINLPNWFRKGEAASPVTTTKARPKLLDTSAIIDGRFFDVYKTGVIEGNIVIPQFVLDELRHIADSADPLKRARGRRGLDAINALQEEKVDSVTVSSADYSDLDEVDTKLLRLALDMDGIVVTNDYNLGKVAAVQNVRVFNINDLANSLRINVVAGEVIEASIVKEGKEYGQGVAYFEDGTMIVVDGGSRYIGQTIPATVTSVLQTSAGRMVFAKAEE
jgi:uncharacterized protein YacL